MITIVATLMVNGCITLIEPTNLLVHVGHHDDLVGVLGLELVEHGLEGGHGAHVQTGRPGPGMN